MFQGKVFREVRRLSVKNGSAFLRFGKFALVFQLHQTLLHAITFVLHIRSLGGYLLVKVRHVCANTRKCVLSLCKCYSWNCYGFSFILSFPLAGLVPQLAVRFKVWPDRAGKTRAHGGSTARKVSRTTCACASSYEPRNHQEVPDTSSDFWLTATGWRRHRTRKCPTDSVATTTCFGLNESKQRCSPPIPRSLLQIAPKFAISLSQQKGVDAAYVEHDDDEHNDDYHNDVDVDIDVDVHHHFYAIKTNAKCFAAHHFCSFSS